MISRKMEVGTEGRLPAMAPLANPYVPFQLENPPKYEAAKGFIRGTLFPGLDLPFMGMVNNRELPATPLSELQVLGFAIQDLRTKNEHVAYNLYKGFSAPEQYFSDKKPLPSAVQMLKI